jgi:hypothetical protein
VLDGVADEGVELLGGVHHAEPVKAVSGAVEIDAGCRFAVHRATSASAA